MQSERMKRKLEKYNRKIEKYNRKIEKKIKASALPPAPPPPPPMYRCDLFVSGASFCMPDSTRGTQSLQECAATCQGGGIPPPTYKCYQGAPSGPVCVPDSTGTQSLQECKKSCVPQQMWGCEKTPYEYTLATCQISTPPYPSPSPSAPHLFLARDSCEQNLMSPASCVFRGPSAPKAECVTQDENGVVAVCPRPPSCPRTTATWNQCPSDRPPRLRGHTSYGSRRSHTS